jgi:hypothetical protein
MKPIREDFNKILERNDIDLDYINMMMLSLIDIHPYVKKWIDSEFLVFTKKKKEAYRINSSQPSDEEYGDEKPWVEYAHLLKFYDDVSIMNSTIEFKYRLHLKPSGEEIWTSFTDSEIEEIKEEVKDIESKAIGDGYKFNVRFDDFDDSLGVPLEGLEITLIKEVDRSTIQKEKNYHSLLPKNIIGKFDDFMARKNIPDADREDLVNILNSGDWSKSIQENLSPSNMNRQVHEDTEELVQTLKDILLELNDNYFETKVSWRLIGKTIVSNAKEPSKEEFDIKFNPVIDLEIKFIGQAYDNYYSDLFKEVYEDRILNFMKSEGWDYKSSSTAFGFSQGRAEGRFTKE